MKKQKIPKKPLTPEQLRLKVLREAVEKAKQAVRDERKRQKRTKESCCH